MMNRNMITPMLLQNISNIYICYVINYKITLVAYNVEVDENFDDAQIQDVDMEGTINENFGHAQIQNVDMADTINENFEDAQIQDVDMEDTVNEILKMHKYKM